MTFFVCQWNPWAILIRIFLISSYLSDLKLDSTLSPLSLPPKMAKFNGRLKMKEQRGRSWEVCILIYWNNVVKHDPWNCRIKQKYISYLLGSAISVSCFLVCLSRNNTSSFSRPSPLRRNSASSLTIVRKINQTINQSSKDTDIFFYDFRKVILCEWLF